MASRPLSCKTQHALASLGSAVEILQEVLREAEPGSVSGDEAKAFVDGFAQAERAGASGIALFAPRVVQTGAHAKDGHGSAADWLGSVSGSSAAVAKDRLAAATRAGADVALTGALHQGELSSAELKLMGEAEAAAPGSAQTLVELAGGGASHQELRDTASRLRAAARSKETERTRRQRVHERRHFRWRQCPEGGVRGEFSCDEVAWARVAPRLEAEAKERWKAAGSSDPGTLEAHRLDAFLEMMADGGYDSDFAGPLGGSGAFCDDEDADGEDETGDDATDENEPDRRRSGPEGGPRSDAGAARTGGPGSRPW